MREILIHFSILRYNLFWFLCIHLCTLCILSRLCILLGILCILSHLCIHLCNLSHLCSLLCNLFHLCILLNPLSPLNPPLKPLGAPLGPPLIPLNPPLNPLGAPLNPLGAPLTPLWPLNPPLGPPLGPPLDPPLYPPLPSYPLVWSWSCTSKTSLYSSTKVCSIGSWYPLDSLSRGSLERVISSMTILLSMFSPFLSVSVTVRFEILLSWHNPLILLLINSTSGTSLEIALPAAFRTTDW
ncbi:unnamed protein product [Moneuplotes crassus]|uniref:Uncharacterized protein n=1 Tax=Euplotes crassus TaxID=5936 RepID=A0AAD1XNH3_EUPCR|nr:unnamed protein product [Moneuplotes crassus]